MMDLVRKVLAQARVLISAWPTFAASITALLAVVAQDFIPHLPGDWPVKAAAYLAAAAGAVAAVSAAVSRVTPILFPEEKGLLPLPEAPAYEGLIKVAPKLDRDAIDRIEREWKAKYAPGSAATGDDLGA